MEPMGLLVLALSTETQWHQWSLKTLPLQFRSLSVSERGMTGMMGGLFQEPDFVRSNLSRCVQGLCRFVLASCMYRECDPPPLEVVLERLTFLHLPFRNRFSMRLIQNPALIHGACEAVSAGAIAAMTNALSNTHHWSHHLLYLVSPHSPSHFVFRLQSCKFRGPPHQAFVAAPAPLSRLLE